METTTESIAVGGGLTLHKDLYLVGPEKLKSMSQREILDLLKDANQRTIKSAKQTLLCIAQTGTVLIHLKENLKYGVFMDQVKMETGLSQRTANNYMAIARHYGNVSNLRGVREALGYIRTAVANAEELDKPKKPRPALPSASIEAEIVPPDNTHHQAAPPLTLEAEIVEPSQDDPAPLVVDGTKPEVPAKPEDKPPAMDDPKQPRIAFEAILEAVKHLTKDELITIKRAIAIQWETLTGKGSNQ